MDASDQGFIADALANGELENVQVFFRLNDDLWPMLAKLAADERLKTRLGVYLLLDAMLDIRPKMAKATADSFVPLLKDEQPHIRGDALGLLELVGELRHIKLIEPLLEDANKAVAELAQDAIDEIRERG